jgi:hypothetical protein
MAESPPRRDGDEHTLRGHAGRVVSAFVSAFNKGQQIQKFGT